MLFKNESAYDKEFQSASASTGVPVEVLKGIAGAESGFNPKSYRKEPALDDASYGLMQILSKTAESLGFSTGFLGMSTSKLYDPATNTLYGAKHFKNLLTEYGNLNDAIAAYNMGSPRTADKTTDTIIKIFGKPQAGWRYANQPYVDNVNGYINYFKTGITPSKTSSTTLLLAISAGAALLIFLKYRKKY